MNATRPRSTSLILGSLCLLLAAAPRGHAAGETLDSGDQPNSYRNEVGGVMPGAVRSVGIIDGGSGYTADFEVTFEEGGVGGSGAKGRALVAGGSVVSVTMTAGGSGYTSPPTVNFSAGGGTAANATAILDPQVLENPETIPGPNEVTGLRSAYEAQRRNGTAFGGFATAGYGTLAQDVSGSPPLAIPQNLPDNAVEGVSEATVRLGSAIIGRPLSVFAVSYNFGGVIPPPIRDGNGDLFAFKAEPLHSRVKSTVTVNNQTGEVLSSNVVDALPTDPDGTTTTIINDERTVVTIGSNPRFYWSKHARKVYATQAGTVEITWARADGTPEVDGENTFTYSIASSPEIEERTLYWTDNGFNGPAVSVPEGSVQEFVFVHNTQVPKEVRRPDKAPWTEGLVDFAERVDIFKRYKTIYEERDIIHAYNVEGRIFVEYLGNQTGPGGEREQLGYEVINVVKDTPPKARVVALGDELTHNPLNDDEGNPVLLEPKVIAGLGLTGDAYIHQQVGGGAAGISLYAVRETQPGVEPSIKIQENSSLVYWLETGLAGLKWPKQYIGYVQKWPEAPAEYSIYARPDAGAPGGAEAALATAVQLDSASNPALVYQDDLTTDSTNARAQLTPANRFYTSLTKQHPTSRALLRFTKDNDVWFERVFSQLDPNYLTPAELLELQQKLLVGRPDSSGDVATGYAGISGVVVSDPDSGDTYAPGEYTVDPVTGVIRMLDQDIEIVRITFRAPWVPFQNQQAAVDVVIGERIEPDLNVIKANAYGDTNPVYVGYIHQRGGTAYDVLAYKDPFVEGFEEAAKGAIIGVNALAGNDQLEVWWYKKSEPGSSKLSGTYWPSFVQTYQLKWPESSSRIVLASNKGSDDLPSLQATGSIYTQNNPVAAGYNPNEEHALMLNGRAWALRDDLNKANSSEPYVLVRYNESDARPAMRVFEVLREDETYTFNYTAVAGKPLQSPMPMPLLPPPLDAERMLASYEVPGIEDPLTVSLNYEAADSAFAHYQKFTWSDRKGNLWVYRGPHQGNEVSPKPNLKMRYFYKTLPGFDFPGKDLQPVGTITPYLRAVDATAADGFRGDPVTGFVSNTPAERKEQPLEITFTPKWPDAAPELRVGETLTLPKLGLPQVRGQQSLELIYQQSIATDVEDVAVADPMHDRKKSARLFDPTRAKVYPLSSSTLPAIPDSVNTSPYLGKTYFPNLPPHLSGRLYFDPAVGADGSLVFKGVFMNEQVGEKYLQLNVMSAADLAAAKDLVPTGDTSNKDKWDDAIDGLATTVETFIENPNKLGTFIVDPDFSNTVLARVFDLFGIPFPAIPGALPPRGPTSYCADQIAEVYYSDTAVDSYALSASGGGDGYVVLAAGNGRDTDFTDDGGPVSLEVFKVNAPLYRGELKVVNSANPLDEKLTMQHTGDFAGHPEEFDFEWRYGPPIDGLPPKLYSFVRKLISGDNGAEWRLLNNPPSDRLEAGQVDSRFRSPGADVSDLTVVSPGQFTINDGQGTAAHGTTLPHALLRRTFSASDRPLRLFLSMEIGANDGAVVYLNNAPVAAYHAPGYDDTPTTSVPATAPAFDPLPLVFEIDSSALTADPNPNNNVFTVELYTTDDAGSMTSFNLRLEGSKEVESLTGWLPVTDPADVPSTESTTNNEVSPPTTGILAVQGKNRHTIQGSSILTLSDNYLIMRYRARSADNAAYAADGGWSKWTEPQLAEGWIKRVLAGINPFQQRVKDLFNHETNTSVSLVEQAGKRWEGNIALNLDNINDSGLVEIYETVLNRGKDLSITGTPAINYGGANDALLLAAGYLNDLYMILGNEAYADAANSTIAFNTDGALAEYGDVATALFSFKGQLATVLDEELSLMRGRDDSLLPGTQKSPIYNRLIWNYTRGIDSGEAIYALNYNIKDRIWDLSINPNNIGDLPTDGIISAADAAISYPQGHGDAYGHYLTALTGYYGLLNNPNFTWTPRIEAVLVLGTPVSVDYQDERKFAAAAASVARSASRTLDLTYRQEFSADEEEGWSELKDGKANPNTGRTRHWGTDDWASRGGQGALFHWVTANSLLPAVDPNPNHSGIQKIDRTTVPELAEIAAQAAAIQQTLDNADARLNPLGLAAGALAFDISPTEVDAGKTHFEQIYERATVALTNAVSAFNNAKGSTQFLRRQEDSLADQRFAIDSQEQAFTNQLVEIYGTPYTDDIGPGRTYKQGYEGPDLLNSMIVEVPEIFQNHDADASYTLLLDPKFAEDNEEVLTSADFEAGATHTYTLSARDELMKPAGWTGRRVSPGRMQTAISNLYLARQDLETALSTYEKLELTIRQQISLYGSLVKARSDIDLRGEAVTEEIAAFAAVKAAANASLFLANVAQIAASKVANAIAKAIPENAGFTVSVGAPAKGAVFAADATGYLTTSAADGIQQAVIGSVDTAVERLNFNYEANVSDTAFKNENEQFLYELHSTLVSLKANAGNVDASLRRLDQAQRELYSLQAEGNRIQKQRLVFRQHTAAIIQGYRTRDFAFRAFRDEALQRYNALFDLSARYTYLAARAYDYETGLLDADGNASAAGFYEKIVQARALGVVSDGQPQFAGASTGDPGLSGVLAELDGDWSVVKTRLGFNNPDRYATTFSLRQEKYRLVAGADGDLPWRDVLSEHKMDNILDDPDVMRYCMQVGDPNGSAVPGIVIPFSSSITTGYNFFGRPLAGGDHTFTPSSFSTKIRSSGIALQGYVGMDSPTTTSGTLDDIGADSPSDPYTGFGDSDALSATPYIYLIPTGADSMRSPPLGDTSFIRTWMVQDQAIPLPFNIANSDYSTQPAWVSAASLSEPAFTLRKHQAFRAVPDGTNFQSGYGFANARLIGRSAWNSEWKIVIPGDTLLSNPYLGIDTFIKTVTDIKLHLETYSYSGN